MIVYTLRVVPRVLFWKREGCANWQVSDFTLVVAPIIGHGPANLACLELFLRFNLLGKVPGRIHINNMDGKFMPVNF